MTTYNTAYKSGTFNGAIASGATTFTVAGFTPSAGDVGRFIIATNGSANLQVREITAVSGQDITISHAWDTVAFIGITDSLPSSGDTCVVSYDADDLVSGDADLTQSGRNLTIAALETTGGAYIHFKDFNITFDSSTIELGEGSGMICGVYGYIAGEDAYIRNTCNIVDNHNNSNGNPMGRGSSTARDFGMFHMYGGNIRALNGTGFWRLYDNSTTSDRVDVRMINVAVFGNFGSRIAGDKSIVIAIVEDAATPIGFSNFLTIARIELEVFNSDQALYVNRSLGPNGRAVLSRVNSIGSKIVSMSSSGSGLFEILGKKSEIDAQSVFVENSTAYASHITRYGNLVKPTFTDGLNLIVGDIKTRMYDNTNTFIREEVVTDGNYTETFVRHTDLDTSTTGNKNLTDGTQYAPYTLRAVKSGKQFINAIISAEDTFDAGIVTFDDTLFTAVDKTAALTQDITVNVASNTITITGNGATLRTLTTEELYNYLVSWLEDNLVDETAFLCSRLETLLDFGAYSVTLDYIALTGSLETTNTLTLSNGSTVSGGFKDATQDTAVLERSGATFTIYASEANRDARTSPLASGVTRYNLLFASRPANTLYLWVTFGDTELPADVTLVQGDNEIDLGTAGLLTSLSTDVILARDNALAANVQTKQA